MAPGAERPMAPTRPTCRHCSVMGLRSRSGRGQALVMFAMFLLVLVLLVLATMSLSHLTHQKMELQVANDTAAYSQAVATARAYNSVALLNRAQVATMVALAGVDSAVSFGGSYRAALNATVYGYLDEFEAEYCGGGDVGTPNGKMMCEGPARNFSGANCRRATLSNNISSCSGDTCKVARQILGYGAETNNGPTIFNPNARIILIFYEWERLRPIWQQLDGAAGLQARSVLSEAAAYGGLQEAALAEARSALSPFSLGSLAVVGGTLNLPSLAVARREFDDGTGAGIIDNGIDVAMGSRAHTFITRRVDGQRAIQDAIRRVLAPSGGANEVTVLPMRGNGYFATTKIHGARPATAYAAWGDEESRITVNYAGVDANLGLPGTASGNLRFESWVGSTDKQNTTDQHAWCPEEYQVEADPPDERHTMPPHAVPPGGLFDPCAASSCIWPSFYDANSARLADKGDVFGQPKLFSSATRDLSQRDPWNRFLTFRFSRGAQTDFRASHTVQGVDPKMQSVSASMAYYHRPGHWKEPPNLFNPYWRATLVRANVDDTWLGDVNSAVSPANGDALNELLSAGYLGIP